MFSRGCTRIAILDLKGSEAQTAATELVASVCGQELCFVLLESFTEYFQVNNGSEPNDFDVIGVECDVSSEYSVQNAFNKTMERFGRIDSVVASAGVLFL